MDEFFEMDDPEIDADFLQSLEVAIHDIERLNMWKVSFRSFKVIEIEMDRLFREIAAYEKRARFSFPYFRELEGRIRAQQRRCDYTKFRVGNNWIPWSER